MTVTQHRAVSYDRVARESNAVSYERISRFRVEREGFSTDVARGVDRQHADAKRVADMMDLGPIVQRFTDNNRSASAFRQREREAFASLLDHVLAGHATHVLVWLLDRAARTTEDLDRLLAACKIGGAVIVQTATGSVVDPNNPESVLHAKISGAVAEYETAKMSMRQTRRKLDDAMAGRPHGGRRRFGYTDGMTALDPVEAPIVRVLVARLLGGESLHSLAKWLNGPLGVPTSTGGQWRASNLGTFLRKPFLAGIRVHHGTEYAAAWPAILTEAEHASVVHLLSDPSRRTSRSTARKYLLAGLMLCDVCEEPVRGRKIAHSTTRAYTCGGSSAHVHRQMTHVDRYVTHIVVERLTAIDATGAFVDDFADDERAQLVADRDALTNKLDALTEQNADDLISDAQLARSTRTIERKISKLDEQITSYVETARVPKAVLEGMTGPLAREAWEDATLGRQRALVDLICERIALRPAPSRRTPFDGDRDLVIDFRPMD